MVGSVLECANTFYDNDRKYETESEDEPADDGQEWRKCRGHIDAPEVIEVQAFEIDKIDLQEGKVCHHFRVRCRKRDVEIEAHGL